MRLHFRNFYIQYKIFIYFYLLHFVYQIEMNQTSQGFGLRCLRGSRAVTLCTNSKCENNAIMCGDEECSCHNNHKKCPNATSLSKLKKVFEQKNQSLLPLLNLVYEGLWKQSKLINVEMEELKKKIESQELAFVGGQKKLYLLLIGKKMQDILPEVVSEAMSSLQKQPQHNISQSVFEAQLELKKKERELKEILDDVKKLIEIEAPLSPQNFYNIVLPDFKFSPTLKHQSLAVINGKIVKADNHLVSFSTTLIQPNLLQTNYKRFRIQLKINKTSNRYLMFGICELTPNLNVKDFNVHKRIECGSLTSYDDYVYLGSRGGDRKESNNMFQNRQNEIIEMEYDRQTGRVTVKNMTANRQSISYIKTSNSHPLHFAVVLHVRHDQVEIIQGESEL